MTSPGYAGHWQGQASGGPGGGEQPPGEPSGGPWSGAGWAPAQPELLEHGLALALGGRCPLCAELADDVGVLARRPCSTCGGTFATPELAARVADEVHERSRDRLVLTLGLLALAGLVLGFVPILGAVTLGVGFAYFQFRVVAPTLKLLSKRRRLVSRWTLRLFTAALALVSGFGVTVASLMGIGGWVTAMVAPATLGLTWVVARAYLVWQMRREREREPIAAVEVAVLGGAVAALGAALAASVALLWAAMALFELLRDKVLRLVEPWI